jgi:hypothetical protein
MSEYVAGANNEYSEVVLYLVTWSSQRAPECDMILVHDDDLSRISGICDSGREQTSYVTCFVILTSPDTGNLHPDVVRDYLQSSNTEIHTRTHLKALSRESP